MPDPTKLAIGEDVTFQVSAVRAVTTGKWPEYELHAADGHVMIAPKAALDRQFAKLKLAPTELAGHVVRLERAPNHEDAKKSWWNLHLCTPADLKPPAPPKRLVSPPADYPTPGHHPAPPVSEAPEGQRGTTDGPLLGSEKIDQLIVEKREAIESAYRWALDVAYAAQWERFVPIGEEDDAIQPTAESIQAGAATLLIQAAQRGAI